MCFWFWFCLSEIKFVFLIPDFKIKMVLVNSNQNWFSKIKFQKRFLPGESHNRNAPGQHVAAAAWVCWCAVWQKRAKAPAVACSDSSKIEPAGRENPAGPSVAG